MAEIIHQILEWLESLGYWGVMIGLMIEIIPSEIVLAYAGYLVNIGSLSFVEAVVFGTIGGVIAQIFLYWIGKYGGRPFLERYGKYLLIHKKHIDVAEAWFNRYGVGMIFTARFIPVVRHAISVPAGMARMSLALFTLYTTLAVIPWSIFFIYLGKTLGENWEQIDEMAAPYMMPIVVAAVAVTVLYLLYKIVRSRSRKNRDPGYAGERNTAHQLKFIGPEYRVFNGRRVRSRTGSQEIDHIVVGPNGVFHIESKNWSGDIRFTEQGVERDKEKHEGDPTAQLYRHEYVLKELLRAHHLKADVTGILCFTHENCRLVGRSPAFETLKLDRLVHFIKNYRPKTPLTPRQVEEIADLIGRNSTPSR